MRLGFEEYAQRGSSDTLVAYASGSLRGIKRQGCRFYVVESSPQDVAA